MGSFNREFWSFLVNLNAIFNKCGILSFLAKDYNKGSVEITGKRVNRGAG